MTSSWKRFLFLQFPLLALLLALIAQVLAVVLSRVPMRRDRTDELALAVLTDPTNYRVVLLGDSITRNATARYSLGGSDEVANLASHADVGIAGELFLLQRYLSKHRAPQYVVIAFAPGMYRWVTDVRLARYHMWYTFNQADERRMLKEFLPDIDHRDWLPAILDLQERILEPFFSFVKNRYLTFRKVGPRHIAAGSENPDPGAPLEFDPGNETSSGESAELAKMDLTPAPLNAESLRQICRLSEQYGFHVNVVWPPMPSKLESALVETGALTQLEDQIRNILGDRCRLDTVFDFNRLRTYSSSSFHRDMIHLFGMGWEQRYASDLREYLSALTRGIAMDKVVN